MTTYTIPGFFFQTDPDDPNRTTFFNSSELSLVMVPGKTDISYSYDEPQTGTETPVMLNGLGTDVYGFAIDFMPNPTFFDGTVVEVKWNDGGTTRTSYVISFEGNGAGDYVFPIGGDPLPDFQSPAEFDQFDNNQLISATDVPASSPFAANKPIALPSIPGVTTEVDDEIIGTQGNDTLLGGDGFDTLVGLEGDDLLNPGDNMLDDLVIPGPGNDTVDMSDIVNGYVGLLHGDLDAAITVNIDGNANTGTIDKGANGTTTLINVQKPILTGNDLGGLGIYGSSLGDTFNIRSADDGWLQVRGGPGADSYNILPSTGGVRLDFVDAQSGIIADFSTGTISNDGFGSADSVTGYDNVTEVRASHGSDNITGSDKPMESWILRAGNDTLDGAGGWDRLRLDRNGAQSVEADLAAGTATGMWQDGPNSTPMPFTYTLSNIEEIRGTRTGADDLAGDANANKLDGRGGDDTLNGRGGDDTIIGGTGVDRAILNDASTNASVIVNGDSLNVTTADGTDMIMDDVELIEFTDGTLSYAQVAALGGGSGAGPNDDFIVGDNTGESLDGGNAGNDTILGLGGNDLITGGPGNDSLAGGDGVDTILGKGGDDVLSPGTNDRYNDVLDPGAGVDTVDLTGIGRGFATVQHAGLNGPFTIDLNFDANTGSIDKGANGMTTLVNMREPASDWGLSVFGSDGNDIYNIDSGSSGASWLGARGGPGNDVYNLSGGGQSIVRLDFNEDGSGNAATQGLTVNLATGTVSNDGFGGTDTINRTGGVTIEVQGTANDDSILGSNNNERFILLGGNDMLDAKGGFDLLRYDREDMGPVNVDLAAGTATGTYKGQAFSHQIAGIEAVRGSRTESNTMRGDDAGNEFRGGDADDTFHASNGFDFIDGRGGTDTVHFDFAQSEAFVQQNGNFWFVQHQNGSTEMMDVEKLVFDGQDYVPGPPPLPPEFTWGFTSGDPHLQTLDGVGYDFHAVGEFVLLREAGVADGFELQARFAPVTGVDNVSVNQAFALRLDAGTVQIDAADAIPLTIDSFTNAITDGGSLDVGNDRIYREGNTWTIVLAGDNGTIDNTDSRIAITDAGGRLDLAVYMGDDLAGKLEGLLGDGDGNAANDIALADGTVLERPLAYEDLYGQYRDDWRVDDVADSLFIYDTGETLAGFYDASKPGQVVRPTDFTDAEQQAARDAAQGAGLEPGTTNYDNAVLDFLLTGDQSFVQSAATTPTNQTAATAGNMAAGETRANLSIGVKDLQNAVVDDARVGFSLSGNTAIQQANFDTGDSTYKVKAVSGSNGSVDGSWAHDKAGDPDITAQDALNVLRLAVGLDASWGAADGFDFVAADVNRDKQVTAADALEILRYTVGLDTDHAPEWVALDADADLSGLSAQNVAYETGSSISNLADGDSENLYAVLLGNMEDAIV